MTNERPLNERPAAKPNLQAEGLPTQTSFSPPQKVKTPIGCIGCATIPFLIIAIIGIMIAISAIASIFNSGNNDDSQVVVPVEQVSSETIETAKGLCVSEIENLIAAPLSSVSFSSAQPNPMTIKVYGAAAGGEFACVVELDASAVNQAIWYPENDGIPKSYVR